MKSHGSIPSTSLSSSYACNGIIPPPPKASHPIQRYVASDDRFGHKSVDWMGGGGRGARLSRQRLDISITFIPTINGTSSVVSVQSVPTVVQPKGSVAHFCPNLSCMIVVFVTQKLSENTPKFILNYFIHKLILKNDIHLIFIYRLSAAVRTSHNTTTTTISSSCSEIHIVTTVRVA